MNIIELGKKILSDCPLTDIFTGGIQIDFTKNASDPNYGIYSVGDSKIKEDVLGNQTRKHSLILYAVNQGANNYDRLVNSSFLLDLSNWLETYPCEDSIVFKDSTGNERAGTLKKISCANGMLFEVPTGNPADGVRYQLQIFLEYKVESE